MLLPAVLTGSLCGVLGLEQEYAGWNRWAYLVFYLAGVVLGADERLRAAVRRDAALAGAVGGVVFAGGMTAFLVADGAGDDPFVGGGATGLAFRVLFGAGGWLLVVALLGGLDRWAARRVARRDPVTAGDGPDPWRARAYAYLLAAVLPLYVLHQPVVVGVAAAVVPWRAPVVVELAVVVAVSTAVLLVVYDLGVRRWRVTRRAFGMRP